jgi:hypothetical protein
MIRFGQFAIALATSMFVVVVLTSGSQAAACWQWDLSRHHKSRSIRTGQTRGTCYGLLFSKQVLTFRER